jgi:2-oxoisovalerate dehydrogenase E1 component
VINTPFAKVQWFQQEWVYLLMVTKAIVEMQFADFVSTGFNPIVNISQIALSMVKKADVVVRMPCGGGTQAGPFHSQTNEAWLHQNPGLK